MSNSDTKWSADGQTIPDIEPHTKTKHLLIEQYITDLICTLYGTGQHGVIPIFFNNETVINRSFYLILNKNSKNNV